MDGNSPPPASQPLSSLDLEDYYFDGPNLVFTAAYHLKRGSCCGSECRHCPYRITAPEAKPTPGPPSEKSA